MAERIDTLSAMKGTPRPHYLVDDAYLESEGGVYRLQTRLNFTSEGHPSIQDRMSLYLSAPHVNIGDACFALWNAAHIIGNRAGYTKRILKGKVEIDYKSRNPIPPNTLINLTATARERRKVVRGDIELIDGPLVGEFSLGGKPLLEIRATYTASRSLSPR